MLQQLREWFRRYGLLRLQARIVAAQHDLPKDVQLATVPVQSPLFAVAEEGAKYEFDTLDKVSVLFPLPEDKDSKDTLRLGSAIKGGVVLSKEQFAKIPVFHLVVELLFPATVALLVLAIGNEPRLANALWLAPVGVAIGVIDLRTMIVPTRIVWPATFVTIAISVVVAAVEGEWTWLIGGGASPAWLSASRTSSSSARSTDATNQPPAASRARTAANSRSSAPR